MTQNPKTRNGCQGMLRELFVQRHSGAGSASSCQEEFEEFLLDHVSKTPSSKYEIYGLHISGRNKHSGQKKRLFH